MEMCLLSEFNSGSATLEIPSTFWNPKVHYHVQNSPLIVSVSSQVNPGCNSILFI
jgi:hypothetical protein